MNDNIPSEDYVDRLMNQDGNRCGGPTKGDVLFLLCGIVISTAVMVVVVELACHGVMRTWHGLVEGL